METVTTSTAGGLGFGCYRVLHTDPVHEEALRYAIGLGPELGVSCIDTSSNYGNGSSELLVGAVMRTLTTPERPLLITKVGYMQGDVLDAAKAQDALGMGFDDIVRVSDTVWHCIEPHFLDSAISTSLERCGVNRLDVVLLHNPEYFLQVAQQQGTELVASRVEFYRRLELAFAFLENSVASGRIAAYGVSSNTFASSADIPDSVSLERCIALAQSVGGADHHFTTAEMPMNLIEHAAATNLNQADGTLTTLERAAELGIRVVVNRPLNAVVDNDLIRLVSHTMPAHIVHPDDVEQRIHALEISEHDLVNSLLANSSLSERERQVVREAFRVAEVLCGSWEKFEGLPHWRDVRNAYLDPRLDAVAVFAQRSLDVEAVQTYHADITSVINDVDSIYAGEENASLEELREALADEFGMPIDTPLQHVAVQALRCTHGVNMVLVGMRRPEYVDDITSVMEMPSPTYHRTTWNRIAGHLARLSDIPEPDK